MMLNKSVVDTSSSLGDEDISKFSFLLLIMSDSCHTFSIVAEVPRVDRIENLTWKYALGSII